MVYNTKDNCIEPYVFKCIARPVSTLSICKGMFFPFGKGGGGGAWPLRGGGGRLGHSRKGGACLLREGEDLTTLGRGGLATPGWGALSAAGRGALLAVGRGALATLGKRTLSAAGRGVNVKVY